MFSTRFDKQDEYDQVPDESEIYSNLNIKKILTESDNSNIDLDLNPSDDREHQIQNQETKFIGWRFDNITSKTVYFYKFIELNASGYLKIPLRSAAINNIEKDGNCYCFWSILAHLPPISSKRASNKSIKIKKKQLLN